MSKTMPKSTKEEKYRWIKPILNGEMTIKLMAAVCPFSERALKYWLADFREHGIAGLESNINAPQIAAERNADQDQRTDNRAAEGNKTLRQEAELQIEKREYNNR